MLKITNILSWIIFIGQCIQTGAFLFSYFVSMFINIAATKDIYLGLNLSELYHNSILYYNILLFMIILISGLKAYLFYFIIKIFLKLNFTHPFSNEIYALIIRISYIALAIGIIAIATKKWCDWLVNQDIQLPVLNLEQYIGGRSEFIFMAAVIFIIAQLFKRGIEIQSENELTI